MRTEILKTDNIDKWIPLANKDFAFGQKYMGEFHMGSEWVKSIISFKKDSTYINFGDLPFTNIGHDNFFIQTKEGNHIVIQWLYFKVHNHLTPVVFDLINKSFKIIDPTRLLEPVKIWNEKGRLYGEFNERVWIDSQQQERLVSFEIGNDFQDIESFYNLDPENLLVGIYSWKDKELTIEYR